jgi:hypothetical protein
VSAWGAKVSAIEIDSSTLAMLEPITFGSGGMRCLQIEGRQPRCLPAAFHDASASFCFGTPVVRATSFRRERVHHGTANLLESREKVGDPPRTRTLNLEIKSLLLYQLS